MSTNPRPGDKRPRVDPQAIKPGLYHNLDCNETWVLGVQSHTDIYLTIVYIYPSAGSLDVRTVQLPYEEIRVHEWHKP